MESNKSKSDGLYLTKGQKALLILLANHTLVSLATFSSTVNALEGVGDDGGTGGWKATSLPETQPQVISSTEIAKGHTSAASGLNWALGAPEVCAGGHGPKGITPGFK